VAGDSRGRHRNWVRATTSQYYELDIRRWPPSVLLTPGSAFRTCWVREDKELASVNVRIEVDRVILSYRYRTTDGESWQALEYSVRIEWTRCNYGGKRAWFRCPATGCSRRVAILYLGGELFACRHCYQLTYICQRQPAHERALSRAQAIRERLGGTANMCMPFPRKPRGMHWRTYMRLRLAYKEADARTLPPSLRRLVGATPSASRFALLGQKNNVPTASQRALPAKTRRAIRQKAKGKANA
jgi:hypothetical protein